MDDLRQALHAPPDPHVPFPVAADWEWQLRGACRGSDPDLFFHPEGERGSRRAQRDLRAKAVCASCPVLQRCRAHALATAEPYGVWGGLTEVEREQLRSGRAAG